ncbi:type 1 glutamine amidotransferase [Aureibacillus halotolerans]|uniref:GMP synthase-like glutamine amidotransferase n=1 Tax=Aureibacillus halotolerans TaxID=1508390 RepID=A0A4R6U464_9BACI|nr:type 1 glutamine amidotransferase [Aureibacillus halotolerans]TDQ40486.1 GMP synthase-like glutamine amidotransferase [Aureibacillus halotolerans]
MTALHCIQHVSFETPAFIEDWAKHRGVKLTSTLAEEDPTFLEGKRADGLIVLGGPMGVNDETLYSWLAPEKTFLKQSLATDKPILGICLGAQLIAQLLGSTIFQGNRPEIGWFEIQKQNNTGRTLFSSWPQTLTPFHWHNDQFTLPPGAVSLGGNKMCECQGFSLNDRVVGLQCHFEMRPKDIETLIEHDGQALNHPASTVMTRSEIMERNSTFTKAPNDLLNELLDKLFLDKEQEVR